MSLLLLGRQEKCLEGAFVMFTYKPEHSAILLANATVQVAGDVTLAWKIQIILTC